MKNSIHIENKNIEVPLLHRVAYAETDAMRVVYYANYLVFYERGRSEYMRQSGLLYSRVEQKGLMLPVIEAGLKYKRSAVYDDLLTIYTSVQNIGRSKVEFSYRILNQREELLNTGFTKHAIINLKGRPQRIPEQYKPYLKGVFIDKPKFIEIDQDMRLRLFDKEYFNAHESICDTWFDSNREFFLSDHDVSVALSKDSQTKEAYQALSEAGELYFIEIYKGKKWIALGNTFLSPFKADILLSPIISKDDGISNRLMKFLSERALQMDYTPVYISKHLNI